MLIFTFLLYYQAKYDANQENKRKAILPLTKSDSNLLHHYEYSNHVPFIHSPIPVKPVQNGGMPGHSPLHYPSKYREV